MSESESESDYRCGEILGPRSGVNTLNGNLHYPNDIDRSLHEW